MERDTPNADRTRDQSDRARMSQLLRAFLRECPMICVGSELKGDSCL
jgi:hypothetical protein